MSSSMYAYQCDLGRVDSLQVFAVADGDEPVFGAVYDVGVAVHVAYPFIGTELIA
jgi:hypothetical protein